MKHTLVLIAGDGWGGNESSNTPLNRTSVKWKVHQDEQFSS